MDASVVMVSRKRLSAEDLGRLLQRINELLGTGFAVELMCREVRISVATYYKWRQLYGGMSVDDAKK